MEISTNELGYEEISLYDERTKRAGTYYAATIEVSYEEDNDQFNIFLWKAGDFIESVYDDWDMEEWLFVKLKHGKDLVELCCTDAGIKPPEGQYHYHHVFDVLYRIYNGDKDAFTKLKKLMERRNFPHKFDYYY